MLLKVLVLCKTKITWHSMTHAAIDEIKRDLSIVVVKAQFSPTLVNKIKLAPMNFSSPVYYPVLACVWKPSEDRQVCYKMRGPIQQYRNKNWQKPKFPCRKSTKCRCLIYGRSCLSKVVSISRVWLAQACMHQKSTSTIARESDEKTSSLSAQRSKCPVIKCNNNSIVD